METRIVVRDEDGLIVNCIMFDPDAEWSPPEGHSIYDFVGAIGGTYINGVYTEPSDEED